MTEMKLQTNVDTLIKEISFLRNLFEVRMQERGRGNAFRCEPGTFGVRPGRLWMSLKVKPLVAALSRVDCRLWLSECLGLAGPHTHSELRVREWDCC